MTLDSSSLQFMIRFFYWKRNDTNISSGKKINESIFLRLVREFSSSTYITLSHRLYSKTFFNEEALILFISLFVFTEQFSSVGIYSCTR